MPKWNNGTKVIKVKIFFKNEMTTFSPTMLLLTLKQQEFVKNKFYLKNCAKYGLDPGPEPELKLFQSRTRNRNKYYCKYS